MEANKPRLEMETKVKDREAQAAIARIAEQAQAEKQRIALEEEVKKREAKAEKATQEAEVNKQKAERAKQEAEVKEAREFTIWQIELAKTELEENIAWEQQ